MTPALSLEDEPIHIVVTGLPARKRVTLELQSVDSRSIPWSSSATFMADDHGRLDVTHAKSISGSYTGIWGVGLLVSMQPGRPTQDALSPGTGAVADEHAREWIWPKLLAFLARV